MIHFIHANNIETFSLIKGNIPGFLYEHLGKYGDSKEAIQAAIDYVFAKGGHITAQFQGDELIGAVVVNQTGMKGYIPENILVYIAVHTDYQGRGLGKALMLEVLTKIKGDVALHVEASNPAKYLYESLGFTNPYLEMRLKRK